MSKRGCSGAAASSRHRTTDDQCRIRATSVPELDAEVQQLLADIKAGVIKADYIPVGY